MSALHAMRVEVRGDFMPNLSAKVATARTAASSTLRSTLKKQLKKTSEALAGSLATWATDWASFEASMAMALTGDLCARVDEEADSMTSSLKGATECRLAESRARLDQVASLEDAAEALDSEIKSLTTTNQVKRSSHTPFV